ncbi:hypothetical protein GCM10022394_25340 [Zobellella aerophila]|uniref:Uncharacterized protein n=1 Tax=Zobellella aerophila TaxID=870480 RepID=A0ABP6W3K1_9GAMM
MLNQIGITGYWPVIQPGTDALISPVYLMTATSVLIYNPCLKVGRGPVAEF